MLSYERVNIAEQYIARTDRSTEQESQTSLQKESAAQVLQIRVLTA